MKALLQSLNEHAHFTYLCVRALLFGTKRRTWTSFSIFFIAFLIYASFFTAPASFPLGHIVTVQNGMTIGDIGALLESERVIRSPFLFLVSIKLLNGEKVAHAGDYYFEKRTGVFPIALRITRGKFGLEPVIVRIPEGFTAKEIAEKFSASLDTFNEGLFLSLAKADEGYLFPDTYHFLPNLSEGDAYTVP